MGYTVSGLAVLAVAYLLGSIPFGYLLVRGTRGVDIRERGSGNIGATNVQRFLGTAAGVSVMVLDGAKGAVAVWVAQRVMVDRYWAAAAAFVVVVGHSFPLFLRFRGGKGVATGGGAFLILAPAAALGATGLFFVLAAVSRIVSFGSVAAAAALPLFGALWYGWPETAAAAGVAVLVLLRHRENIGNLLRRRERRLGAEEEEDSPARGEMKRG